MDRVVLCGCTLETAVLLGSFGGVVLIAAMHAVFEDKFSTTFVSSHTTFVFFSLFHKPIIAQFVGFW